MQEDLDEDPWNPDGDANRPKLLEWIERTRAEKAAHSGVGVEDSDTVPEPRETDEMTVSYPPLCISCSHLRPKRDGLMSCEAFKIIPGVVVFNGLDHRQPMTGDKGIQFEQDPDRPALDHEAYDALFQATTERREP